MLLILGAFYQHIDGMIMAAYEWNSLRRVWCRTCSSCRTIFYGTFDEEESIRIFQGFFGFDARVGTDGFQCHCKKCKRARKKGLRLTQFYGMYEDQGGVCAICTKPITIENCHIDHCHNMKVVRGLLCHSCNIGIGNLQHDIGVLRAAISYLQPKLRLIRSGR